MSVLLVAGSLPLTFAGPAERVLIEYEAGQKEAARDAIVGIGGKIHYEFDRINAMAATIDTLVRSRLGKQQGVLAIEADGKRYPAGDTGEIMPFGVERVQAPLVWGEEYDGEGVTVCIIDSGLGVHHEDFRDKMGLSSTSSAASRRAGMWTGAGTAPTWPALSLPLVATTRA